jgi:hypothetical protein
MNEFGKVKEFARLNEEINKEVDKYEIINELNNRNIQDILIRK